MPFSPAANRSLLTILVAAAGGYLFYLLTPILAPFLVATALAYLCNPLVDRLQARGVSRALATVLVLLGLVLLFLLVVAVMAPLFQAQARLLMQQVPRVAEWGSQTLLPWFSTTFGVDLMNDQADILAWLKGHVSELSQLTRYLPKLKDSGLALLGFVANLLLIPVVLFYLLRDWHGVIKHLVGWIPAPLREKSDVITREVDVVLSEFVRGQIMVILVMCLFYSLALWLAGLHYALAVGLLAGILVFVPYMGVVVGVLLGTLAGWAQFGAEANPLAALIPIWVVFGIGQLLEGMVITPWLVGERVGLHPVAVIFALMAFGQLFGFVGVLLAIPAAAAFLVALRHLKVQLD
ncbi:MAG: AI-2E family transporter [Gallionellaceae bacterium]|nr:AI-2E family transporter [Gallionellaceae bacterium]